ncbi:PD-(D/E)XK nuclease family protein [Rhizobium binae]|uniref:PD-(D/E)XK endonuclease-like domain-containing protein n=1 Tax=Rhizobium binae TaxID=1138190 RepID=A0ABV2MPB9_9HYPH|nr:PD-(D/E)XK nuclease family protein [Rhizobium binae]NKL51925.1 PD-(D/E)XK nuclease family protein [Rhizobium leguminosarum bv. viciae]MBX4938030.1 PD-(D/E)XK nuclease family protein [Rhizobium binae]MBX4944394.1 PD-(D/E)XK nuclease family protein [Rhizobium binae]MBX4980492.1 PD-(D/E)XK nuclease family protein [Rhizobium binae]MBX4995666.1 PD-(D/E)XK nuclease family protein [Rhizobium binae]
MSIHTVIVDGPLALRMQRLTAAREGAIGRQILTLPLLAARLAGGFIAPASQETLYPAIRAALDAGMYEDIGQVSGLPGMPSAVLTSLRSWWEAGILTEIADNPRLRDFAMLERRVREALPPGTLAPPDLVEAALKRLHLAPKLLGSVTLHEVPDIKPIWHRLIMHLCDVVPVRWVGSAHCQRSWFPGNEEVLPAGRSRLAAADVCADPRSEVREALRWARALIAEDGISPSEIAITATSPSTWDDTFLVLAREAGLPLHFSHGVPALATREGQSCAALADVLLRGLSQERVRLLFARVSPARQNIPLDWAKGLRRSAALSTAQHWRHALMQARAERADGDAAEKSLLPVIEVLASGLLAAERAGRLLLRGPALTLWQDALRMAPPQAVELSLQALRVDDGREPGSSVVWGPTRHLAGAPRKYLRLLGLEANAWPRQAVEDPLLPQHLLDKIKLPSADIADEDRMMYNLLVAQSDHYALSRGHRSATGALQAASTLWRRDQQRIVSRSAIPRHAFSESDRLYARPVDAGKQSQIRSSRACWRAWQDSEQHTAHDGLIRANHHLVLEALAEVQSTTSLNRLLCNPLGFVWEYALHWREPNLDPQPLALDQRAFGELVHALIGGVLRNGAPRNVHEIDIGLADEAKRLGDIWPIARAVPPGLLWRHTMTVARERASRGLRDALGEPRGTSWTELTFGEPIAGPHPWTTLSPVSVGATGIAFRGRIDRLDEDASRGAAIITDYKAGAAPERKKTIVFNRGMELQRVFYALAAKSLLPEVRYVESRLTYLRHEPARTLSLVQDELAAAIEEAITFTAAAVELQKTGQIALGPQPEFFDPISIALPSDLDVYRRTKQRPFAQVNSPLSKLWSSP